MSKIPHHVPISANHLWNLDELLERIWEYLGMIRIYTKPKCVRQSACLSRSSSPSLTAAGLVAQLTHYSVLLCLCSVLSAV